MSIYLSKLMMDNEMRKKDMTAPTKPTAMGWLKKKESMSWLDLSSLSIMDLVSNQEFNLLSMPFIKSGLNTISRPIAKPARQPTLPIHVIALTTSSAANTFARDPKKIPTNFEMSSEIKKKKSENADPATKIKPMVI